ncbi:uncharacterized protein DS421_2g46000 [Arachis hypogaea]|nr:uncharacterized protein DS421_2g46000 [Arachis hypogaea]
MFLLHFSKHEDMLESKCGEVDKPILRVYLVLISRVLSMIPHTFCMKIQGFVFLS